MEHFTEIAELDLLWNAIDVKWLPSTSHYEQRKNNKQTDPSGLFIRSRSDLHVLSTDSDGNLHSVNDEPALMKTSGIATLNIVYYWFDHGILTRKWDRPSMVCTELDHSPIYFRWCFGHQVYNCREHFSDTPHEFCDPVITVHHRDNDKPTEIAKDYAIWRKHGVLHRDNDMPSYISRNTITYYKFNAKCRQNGLPCHIEEGKIWTYKCNGICSDPFE